MPGAVRRRPYPADAIFTVNGVDVEVLLAREKKGQAQLVEQKATDLSNVAPTDYRYGSLNPLRERTQPYESLAYGFGLDEQQDFQDHRYSYALGVDASCGYLVKGPTTNQITPGTTSTFASTFGFELGGNLYALAGRYVLARTGDTAVAWTVSKDLGSGKAATGSATFYSAASASNLAFVAVAGDKAYYFTGASSTTVWTQFATFTAIDFAVTGRQFYRAHDTNLLNLCALDADPTNEANWTVSYTIGDKSSAITRLGVAADGTLYIFKTDGVYTLAGSGDPHQFWPFMKFAPNAGNGKVVGYFLNDVYTQYNGDLYKIDPSVTLSHVGPERIGTNSSEVRGQITSFAGVGGLFGLAGLRNTDTGNGYTMKWGGFVPDSNGEFRRIDTWHGSITRKFTSAYPVASMVSAIGAPTNHTRTYFGFSDGTVAWVINPCTPNPAACTAYTFLIGDDTIFLADQHFTFRPYKKNLRGWTVDSPNLGTTRSVTVSYRLDSGGSFVDLQPTFNVPNGQRQNFPPGTQSKLLGVRYTLSNSVNTETPIVHSTSAHTQMVIDRVMTYKPIVQAQDGLHKRNGTPFRRGAQEFTDAIEAAVDAGSFRVTWPDGKTVDLSAVDYAKTLGWDVDIGQWKASLAVTAFDFASLQLIGIIDNLSDLTVDGLSPYSVDQLATL